MKKKAMRGGVLLQTRVPAPLARRVRRLAAADGRTVASWLRWLCERAATPVTSPDAA